MKFVLLALFYFLFPVLVVYLDKKSRLVNRIGPVVICYGMGLLVGSIGILPEGIEDFRENLCFLAIVLAIPMILFSLDIMKWLKMARSTLLSLVLGLVSVLIMTVVGYYLYRDVIPEVSKVSGVLVGYYSGGAPNAAAISVALGMEPETWLLTQTYDLAVGAVTLLFLMTVAQRFFLLFMRPYQPAGNGGTADRGNSYHARYESYDGVFRRSTLLPLLGALGLSVLVAVISAGIGMLLTDDREEKFLTLVVIGITSLGIAASFMPRIRGIDKSFQGGIYLILVFCLVFSSMADISMFSRESVPILMFVVLVVPGALLVHGILSWMFGIDVDNFLIISVALSMSPPFVPAVASSLRNRDIIMPGMIVGMVGYAAGTYLGVLVGNLIHLLG